MTATDGAVKEPTGVEELKNVEPEVIELTPEELESRVESETDRRVNMAAKKWKADAKAEMEKAIEAAKKEAEEMANLNAEERFKLEQEKERKKLEEERTLFQKEKLLLETEKMLVEKKLKPEYAKWLMGNTLEETSENIETFRVFYEEDQQVSVEERLRGKTPKVPGEASPKRYTREQLETLSREEINANWEAIEASMKNL